jgi:hypothetical protein
MTEKWDPSLESQITSKMHELISCMCVVSFKEAGERRGIIEQIESLILGQDFAESFSRSRFKVHFTSGDFVIVPGSAISEIESSATADINSQSGRDPKKQLKEIARKTAQRRAKLGSKTKAGTKAMPAQKRKSTARKSSKAAVQARSRRAKKRKVQNG